MMFRDIIVKAGISHTLLVSLCVLMILLLAVTVRQNNKIISTQNNFITSCVSTHVRSLGDGQASASYLCTRIIGSNDAKNSVIP